MNVPENIHVAAIAILGTGLLGLGAGIGLLWFLIKSDRKRALQAFGVGCAVAWTPPGWWA